MKRILIRTKRDEHEKQGTTALSFLNQPIVIWFLSAVIIGSGGTVYRLIETHRIESNQHIHKLQQASLELQHRADRFEFLVEEFKAYTTTQKQQQVLQNKSAALIEEIRLVELEIIEENAMEASINADALIFDDQVLKPDLKVIVNTAKRSDPAIARFFQLATFSSLKSSISQQYLLDNQFNIRLKHQEGIERELAADFWAELQLVQRWLTVASSVDAASRL